MHNFEFTNPYAGSASQLRRYFTALVVFCAAIAVQGNAQTFTKLADLTTATGYASYNLAQGVDGNFYGTMFEGGASSASAGTVFQLTPSGTITVIHDFCMETGCPDGAAPYSGLRLASDGYFYGSTSTSPDPSTQYVLLER
jgi:uncharacterized repeat protein (TIGR03803 family)